MIRETVVFLAVAFEDLPALARETAYDLLVFSFVGGVGPFDEEEVRIVADALPVGHLQR